jgi:hypothetical protein
LKLLFLILKEAISIKKKYTFKLFYFILLKLLLLILKEAISI